MGGFDDYLGKYYITERGVSTGGIVRSEEMLLFG